MGGVCQQAIAMASVGLLKLPPGMEPLRVPATEIRALVAEFLSAWALSVTVLDEFDQGRLAPLGSAVGDRGTRQVLEMLGLLIATRRGYGGGEEIVGLLGEFRGSTFAAVPEVAQVLALAALIVGRASLPPASRYARDLIARLTERLSVCHGLSDRLRLL